MESLNNRDGELWQWWCRTSFRRPRISLLIDAPTGRAFQANDIMSAAETVFRLGNFKSATGCVAWVLPNGLDWLAIFLATQKAGWAALPLDPGFDERQGRELAGQLGATHWWNGQTLSPLGSQTRRWRGVAVVKVTSGSTGQAAAIPCQAKQLCADYEHIRAGMGLRLRDKNLGLIPFGHSYGLGNLLMPLLVDGIPIITAAAYTIAQINEWAKRYHPTVFPSVPAVFKLLAETAGSHRLGKLRLTISAGAPLAPEVAQAFARRFGRKIHNFYGASETGGICYDRTGSASPTGRSVGRPLPGVRIKLRAGRVQVHSTAVATRSKKYLLPDCGRWNEEGELVLTGRVGRQANLAGRKVAPAEIESLLRTLPGVTDAWCGVGVHVGRDFLVAAVETSAHVRELTHTLSARLPTWKQPRTLVALPQFPRTVRGKIDTLALARQLGV
ncbi:MAG TPA: fatty acid--CoA ligase family protein [Opitutales bacterium]|jgi:acyl-coenzyme A synthetase/AMP-(fatty) acid ligase|nr:fatty acid--CoA ligase family protein [Opitutales bacterium]